VDGAQPISVVGVVLLGGSRAGPVLLLVSALEYVVVQGHAESGFWNLLKNRTRQTAR
jgi:hypothetical protein